MLAARSVGSESMLTTLRGARAPRISTRAHRDKTRTTYIRIDMSIRCTFFIRVMFLDAMCINVSKL